MYMTSDFNTLPDAQFADALFGRLAEARWLIDAEHGAAADGKVGSIAIAPGGSVRLAPVTHSEQAVFVLNGDGAVLVEGKRRAIEVGSTVFVPGGRSIRIEAEGQPLRLLLIQRGSPRVGDLATWPGAVTQAPILVLPLNEVDSVPFHKPELGFHHVAARWLVNAETTQSAALIVGQSTFVPGGAHLLHRHDRAEEFFFVIEGTGIHLVDERECAMAPGDIVFTAVNEWHGFRNTGSQPVRAVFGYFGANRLEAAGYEVHPDVAVAAAPR
jgi:mannose-6-phosphate isomerase-like protein (cupin superfamily)